MCLLICGLHLRAELPLIVAANRDEYYDRPSLSPGLLVKSPLVVGGRDLRAGGTWLGLNEYGVLVAVTNRYDAGAESAGRPSRGALCLDALSCRTPTAARQMVADALRRQTYNPFNLLAANAEEAWVMTNAEPGFAVGLQPGWHVIGNGPLDDRDDTRVQRAFALLETMQPTADEALARDLERVCGDHGAEHNGGARDALCVHRDQSGTRSSTVLVVERSKACLYRHAPGPPCCTPYERVPVPWR